MKSEESRIQNTGVRIQNKNERDWFSPVSCLLSPVSYLLDSGFWILLFSLILTSPAKAVRPYTPVHPDPVLESWRWRSFPELNGLGLRCMAEATDKAMWFGVDDGVRRYDGVQWTAYTEKDGLYGAPVVALCATRDGSVYAGTSLGISRFKEGKWHRVFPPTGDRPWNISRLMESKDGSVWAGTAWGALRLDQQGSVLYTTKDMGNALRTLAPYVRLSIVPEEAAPARLWGNGVGIATTSAWSSLGKGSLPEIVLALAPGGPGDQAGLKVGDRIFAREPSGDSVKLTVQREGRTKPFEVTVTQGQIAGTYRGFPISEVYEDREGVIWFGLGQRTDGGEIVRYAPLASPGTPHSALRTQSGGSTRRRTAWTSGVGRTSPRPGTG